MRNRHGYLVLGFVLVFVSLAAAGCGGSAGSPGVANLGTDANTTGTSSGAPSGSGQGLSSSGGGSHVQMMLSAGQNGLKFSQCMRAHGVSNFPDPNSQGQIQVGPSSGIDPSSSSFQSAQQACQHLLGHGKPSPAEQAKARRQALAFSACMRKHGLPDFPDPTFSNGGVGIHLNANGGSSDLNPSSPTFQAAQQACQGLLPFKGKAQAKIGSVGGGK